MRISDWSSDVCSSDLVHDLVEREQAEVDGHHLDDRPHPAERRADARAHERELGERRVTNPLGAELLEQSLAHGEAAAVTAHVLEIGRASGRERWSPPG